MGDWLPTPRLLLFYTIITSRINYNDRVNTYITLLILIQVLLFLKFAQLKMMISSRFKQKNYWKKHLFTQEK